MEAQDVRVENLDSHNVVWLKPPMNEGCSSSSSDLLKLSFWFQIYSSVFVMATEGREDSEQVEVPKALGDLFEAVAGAIYLDCGADLERVWEIYLPILKPSIGEYADISFTELHL